jgi:hypothetical protein
MIELQMARTYVRAHLDRVRADIDEDDDAGFTTLEWMAIAGVVVAAAIIIAVIVMNKAKDASNNINVQ